MDKDLNFETFSVIRPSCCPKCGASVCDSEDGWECLACNKPIIRGERPPIEKALMPKGARELKS